MSSVTGRDTGTQPIPTQSCGPDRGLRCEDASSGSCPPPSEVGTDPSTTQCGQRNDVQLVADTITRMLPKKTDWAYLAAFLEADGCITVRESGDSGRLYVRMSITQRTKAPLGWIKETFGGRLDRRTRTSAATFREGTSYRWTAESGLATYLLPNMRPYMKVKTQVADLALELCRRPAKPRQAEIRQEIQSIQGYARER